MQNIRNVKEVFEITGHNGSISSIELINTLVKFIKAKTLFKTINKRTHLYRIRNEKCKCTLKQLAAHSETKSSRFSPERNPAFYASFDFMTAQLESKKDSFPKTIGIFTLKKKSKFINLSIKKAMIPSIFDVEKQHIRNQYLFINGFIDNVNKHINEIEEYKPIQYIAQNLRMSIRSCNGIIYNSSKSNNYHNIILWPDTSTDDRYENQQAENINSKLELKQCYTLHQGEK